MPRSPLLSWMGNIRKILTERESTGQDAYLFSMCSRYIMCTEGAVGYYFDLLMSLDNNQLLGTFFWLKVDKFFIYFYKTDQFSKIGNCDFHDIPLWTHVVPTDK